ncbi:metallophosphoesterase [Bifidobacterium aerophilum]|uniref:Calcineurin-like phosphoesterase domain-containing protein n=1 Tax=Bifidobacterium aerophilum TaxID=1798155 RepID=A0A6N9Z2Y3_9BIFI|nr:metallophosphoesterase [Bifidobacterium aerophilum]NEG88613.1 hypothetical protein [Bifidobacterium aerophilum]
MDRILFVGDIHDKAGLVCPMIDETADATGAGVIVLLGDLLNEWDVDVRAEADSLALLADWVERQRERREVVVLLGDHSMLVYDRATGDAYRIISSRASDERTAGDVTDDRMLARHHHTTKETRMGDELGKEEAVRCGSPICRRPSGPSWTRSARRSRPRWKRASAWRTRGRSS